MAQEQEDRAGYWRQTLDHFLSSGLSQAEYAKQYKISRGSLHKWSKALAMSLNPPERAASMKKPELLSFIELQSSVQPIQPPLKLEILRSEGLTIKAEITAGWDQVVALLKALAH